jgi:integrase/recombinase XerD
MNTLQTSLQDYLAMRRGLGFKLHDAGVGLRNFVSFMEHEQASHITIRLALEWAQKPQSVLPSEWARRLSIVRGFARYLSAIDCRTEVPSMGLLPYRPKRAKPYFYTDQEIEDLLAAALDLPPSGGLRGQKYHCLFGLLSVSGLRISEALNLKLEDIDLHEGVLRVQKAKFGKSRLVPLHPSTQKALSSYIRRRNRFVTEHPASYLFASRTGSPMRRADVYLTFYRLSRQIGLRGPSASHGPRLHDMRHRFALKTMLGWYRNGQEIERRLPTLSTYLGHVNVADTYWYLSACPELMGLAVERLERHWEGRL